MKNVALNGKPYAGNPHVRFDEGGKFTWRVPAAACVAAALCLGALHAGADNNITSNTQLSEDTDWTGRGAVTIDAGVTLDLCGHRLRVDGLAGAGTVTDSTALGANLIADGSFENVTVTGNSGLWGYPPSLASSDNWKTDVAGRAGFAKAGSPWADTVKGAYSAYVQRWGNLWQTVTVAEAGDYALTYSYKSRIGYDPHDLAVLVDGASRQCGKTTSAAGWAVNIVVLHLAAGQHRIEFLGLMQDDYSTILDDVSLRKIPAAGELHVVVPAGETAEVTSVRLEGALKFVKEGAGTYRVSYRNGSGVKAWYVGGTSVREGTFSVHEPTVENPNDYNFYQTQPLGAQGSETTVEAGATFDCGGNYDGFLYTIVLNGGTFANMGAFNQGATTGSPFAFRLTADSFLVAENSNNHLGETDLAGHTLTVTTGPGKSFVPSGAIRDGTVVNRGGRFYPRASADLSEATLVLESTMSCNYGTIPIRDLKVDSSAGSFGHGDVNFFTVSGTYTPVSDQIWRFKLLDGATIDLSGRTTTLPDPAVNGLFFEENAKVYVALGDRQVSSSDLLISWSAKPANVEFCTVPGVDGSFRILDGGLVFVANDEDIPVIAHWTGGGDVSNLADPGNWACTNKYGQVLEDAIPEADSTVYLPREIPFNPAGTSFTCGELVLAENSVLTADCDLTGLYVPINTTLDLRGHKLFVDGLPGAGTVTDSTALGANLIADGSFENVAVTAVYGGSWADLPKNASSANWTTDVSGRAGFTKANTTWAGDVKGTYAAYVQRWGNLWQTVTVAEAGDYALTYSYKSRKGYGAHDLAVLVDGASRQCGKTSSAADWAVNVVVLRLAAGQHRIEFLGLMQDDYSTILDDISLRKIPAAGELHVVVANGQVAEVTSVTIEGALKFVKEGAGTHLASYRSGSGVKTWYLGGTSVREGCFKIHDASASDYNFYPAQQLGAQGTETTVEAGATFDCGGNTDGSFYTIVLNGGTFGNMGAVNPSRDVGTPLVLRLTADSFVDAMTRNVQVGDTDLAGHVLTIDSASSCYPCGVMRGGTVVNRRGRFYPRKGVDCSTVDLVLEGQMSCGEGTVPFHDLKVTSTAGSFGYGADYFYTVSGTYTPTSDRIWRFKLLNGSTIDLSGRTTALPNPAENGLFFEENAKVYVALGDRQVDSEELLISWNRKPMNVEFCTVPGVGGSFRILDEGLTFVANDENVPVLAHWTGNGDAANVSDPANWACTNRYGRVVADAIPAADSTVYLPREIPFNPAGTSFTCKELVLAENSVLAVDCDWTGLHVPINTSLDLRGHRLFVSELLGTGTVTDSTALGANLIADGSFENVTVTGNNGLWGQLNGVAASSANWATDVSGRAGFTRAYSTWAGDVKGSFSAFIQRWGNLWQTVTVAEAGDYALTYSYKSRKGYGPHDLAVLVDGASRQCGKTTSAADWDVNVVVLHLAAGEHRIEFLGLMQDDFSTILDDVSLRKVPAAGELHVVVPEGETTEVTSVRLEGALKLVKDGAGTYLVSYKNGGVKTWHLGGTSVRDGFFKVHQPADQASQTDYNFYLTQSLGAQGSEIMVEEGATFDCGGNYDGFIYTIVLDGGTFGNMEGFAMRADTGTPLCLRLTADSFAHGATDTQLGETDLAGHTLDVTTDKGSLYPRVAIRNGTLISRGGRFWPYAVDCSTVDLELSGTMSCNSGTITAHDLKVTSLASNFGHGTTYFFSVTGTYTPVSDQVYRFKLLNGSTINLSGRTTTLVNPVANGLFFEENATIYVDLGARKVKSSEPLIAWSAKPANVKFRAAPGTAGVFAARDDGLYRKVGFGIIVR